MPLSLCSWGWCLSLLKAPLILIVLVSCNWRNACTEVLTSDNISDKELILLQSTAWDLILNPEHPLLCLSLPPPPPYLLLLLLAPHSLFLSVSLHSDIHTGGEQETYSSPHPKKFNQRSTLQTTRKRFMAPARSPPSSTLLLRLLQINQQVRRGGGGGGTWKSSKERSSVQRRKQQLSFAFFLHSLALSGSVSSFALSYFMHGVSSRAALQIVGYLNPYKWLLCFFRERVGEREREEGAKSFSCFKCIRDFLLFFFFSCMVGQKAWGMEIGYFNLQ